MPTESITYTTTCPNLTAYSCCQLPESRIIFLAQATLLISSIAFGIFYAYNAIQSPNLLIEGAELIAPIALYAIVIALSMSLLILYLTVKRFKQHVWSLRTIEMLALIAFAITSAFMSYATYVTSHAIAITGLVLSLLSIPILILMTYIHCRKNVSRHTGEPSTEMPEPIYVNLELQELTQQPTAEQVAGYNILILAASHERTTKPCCQLESFSCNQVKCSPLTATLVSLAFMYIAASIGTLFAYDKFIGTALIALRSASVVASILLLVALIMSIIYITCRHSCRYITSSIALITLAAFTMLSVSTAAFVIVHEAHKSVLISSLAGAVSSLIFLGLALITAVVNCLKLKKNGYNHPSHHLGDLLRINREQRNEHIYVTMPTMHTNNGSSEHIYETLPITM